MLKSKKFWSYDLCQTSQLRQELFDNYKIKGKFYEDVLYFYKEIGIAPHPSLRQPTNKEITEVTSISFINSKVDLNTLKILIHLLPYSKIVSLKFCTNNFDINNLEYLIDSILTKQNNVFFFSYEWNDKLSIEDKVLSITSQLDEINIEIFKKQQELMNKLCTSQKLEGLCLRGNLMGDECAIKIFETLKENQALKSLSLYNNNLTSACIDAFCSMLLSNRKLEEINLGRNKFIDDDVTKIKDNTGMYLMSNEDVENYNKKVKERDQIIKNNAKLRSQKKPEVEVPFLNEMENINGQNFIVKNKNLKSLNLMQNNLTDKCLEDLKFILENNEELLITINEKIFSEEQRNQLLDRANKFKDRIYFSK